MHCELTVPPGLCILVQAKGTETPLKEPLSLDYDSPPARRTGPPVRRVSGPAPTDQLHACSQRVTKFRWTKGFSGKEKDQRLIVANGTTVEFDWDPSSEHNVYRMADKAAFGAFGILDGTGACDWTGSTLIDGGQTPGAKYTFHGADGQNFYFGCKVGMHCSMGQKLEVTISASAAEPIAPPSRSTVSLADFDFSGVQKRPHPGTGNEFKTLVYLELKGGWDGSTGFVHVKVVAPLLQEGSLTCRILKNVHPRESTAHSLQHTQDLLLQDSDFCMCV